MRLLSFDLMAHNLSCPYPFSVYYVVITFTWIVHTVLWNRFSSLLPWTRLASITSVPQFIRFKRFSTVSYVWYISELISRLYLCTWNVCLVRVRYCGMMCHPLMIYQLNFAPSYHLVPVHFLKSAIMAGYYSMHLFPVSASSISLHRCYCTCILSCGCVGLSVRR